MLILRLLQYTIVHASIAVLLLFSVAEAVDKFDCEDVIFQNFSEPSLISSPFYPEKNYPNLADCHYKIIVEPGSAVKLTLLEYKMESCCDTLRIYNQWSEAGERQLIKKVRGTTKPTIPFSIRSHSNIMQLHFTSDLSNNDKGFLGVFESIPGSSTTIPASISSTAPTVLAISTDKSVASTSHHVIQPTPTKAYTKVCAKDAVVFNSSSGVLLSPNYPELYPNKIDCFYEIVVPKGRRIHMNIETFETEACCDYLEYFDGRKKMFQDSVDTTDTIDVNISPDMTCQQYFNSAERKHHANHVFRGRADDLNQRSILSDSNFICLAFHTDPQNQFTGFLITYKSVVNVTGG